MASANRMSTGRPLPGHCGSLAGWSSRDRRSRLRREFNCSKGHSGVFFTDRPGSSLDECVLGCERCERCRFVSYSKRFGDCSWYEKCPLLVKGDAGRAIPTGGKAMTLASDYQTAEAGPMRKAGGCGLDWWKIAPGAAPLTQPLAARSRRQESVCLVMSDSRSIGEAGYHGIAAVINSQFAQTHGYRFFYLHQPCIAAPAAPTPASKASAPGDGQGACGITSFGGDCNEATSGAWRARQRGIRTLEHCAAAAEGCKYANYVSFSAQFDDCSWFSTCDLPHLIGGAAFVTRILRTTTALADPKLCSACTHPTLGGRAAPWCKLLTINQTLMLNRRGEGGRGHEGRGGARAARRPSCERVVYLDSDVYVLHPNRSLGALLDCADATLSVFKNAPYDGRELSAVMVWRNGGVHAQRSRELLSEWWGTGRFRHLHHAHPFEQDALQKELAVRFPGEVAVLPHLDHWFAHVGSFPPGTANQRAQRMRDHVRAHGIEPRVALSVLEHGEDMVMERMGASE